MATFNPFGGRPQEERRFAGRLKISIKRGFQYDQFIENVYTLVIDVVNADTGLQHGCQWEIPIGPGAKARHLQSYVMINRRDYV